MAYSRHLRFQPVTDLRQKEGICAHYHLDPTSSRALVYAMGSGDRDDQPREVMMLCPNVADLAEPRYLWAISEGRLRFDAAHRLPIKMAAAEQKLIELYDLRRLVPDTPPETQASVRETAEQICRHLRERAAAGGPAEIGLFYRLGPDNRPGLFIGPCRDKVPVAGQDALAGLAMGLRDRLAGLLLLDGDRTPEDCRIVDMTVAYDGLVGFRTPAVSGLFAVDPEMMPYSAPSPVA